MPQSNLPIDKRRPGTFITYDYTSGARGLVPNERSVLLIGMKHSTGTATVNVPIQTYNEREADTYFGVGSEAALMVRMALATVRVLKASAPQLWVVPIAEPSGAAATRTLTVTGPATAAGDVVFRLAGRTLRAPVKSGDSANTVAAAIKATIDTMAATSDLPGTAGVSTNVVTFTYRHLGV